MHPHKLFSHRDYPFDDQRKRPFTTLYILLILIHLGHLSLEYVLVVFRIPNPHKGVRWQPRVTRIDVIYDLNLYDARKAPHHCPEFDGQSRHEKTQPWRGLFHLKAPSGVGVIEANELTE